MRSSVDAADLGILVVVPNATDMRSAFVQMCIDTLSEQVLQCVETRPTAANDNGTMLFSAMQKKNRMRADRRSDSVGFTCYQERAMITTAVRDLS